MRVYNLEIFSPAFELKDHTTVGSVEYVDDFLYPEETYINAATGTNVATGDYVRMGDICGVVTSLENDETWGIEIRIKPFTSLLSFPVMFDTDWQGVGTLEERLAQIITDNLINNADSAQNVPGLSVSVSSSTSGWGFNLKALTEGTHKLIIGFYDTLLVRALKEYSVAASCQVDFSNHTIAFTIGTVTGINTVEADLPNVIRKSIAVDQREYTINKLVLYDTDTLVDYRTYYLHPDGTFDTTDTNRVTPVVFDMEAVYSDGDLDAAAASRAREVFGDNKIENLIEIEVMRDDPMLDVEGAQIGQEYVVLSGGKTYRSIVTGKKLGQTATLILGAVRLELEKVMYRRLRHG